MNGLLDPLSALEAENARLRKINAALMKRVERSTDISGGAYSLFQTAIALESEVRARTRDLQATLSDLATAKEEAERARADLASAIESLQEGFALFGPDDRLVMANRWFRSFIPEIAPRIAPGVGFSDYAALAAASGRLELEKGQSPDDWRDRRLALHAREHATFVQGLKGDRWVQISERRAPRGGSVIVQTDITDLVRWERRERDKRLDEQARLVRATLDHLSQGVCVFDASNTLVAWNDRYRALLDLPFSLIKPGASFARIAGYIARHTIISSQDKALEVARWVEAGPERPPLSAELRRFDGRVLDAHCRVTPDGGFVISFTDVTDERAAAEALERRVRERTMELSELNARLLEAKEAAEEANLSKTRFLAAASHDLLQPLNAARLFIASLAEGPLPTAQGRLVERVDSAFQSVEHLLGALLDISKLDAKAVEATARPIPVSAILGPIENEFRPVAAARGLRWRVTPSEAFVMSDPAHLRRVVQNLVSNAMRYTQKGGVLLGCRRRGESLRIEVWDTGVGVAPEHQRLIFEEFRRIDGAAGKGAERGAGLGLAIVERACRLLGHKIELCSIPGRGSMFSVTAPLAPAAAYAPETEEIPPEGRAGGLIALVVENDADIREGMTLLLDRWGVDVLGAGSTEEALSIARDLGMAPDAIIADYHLEGEDTGLTAIAALRIATGVEIPAILATADRSPGVIRAAAAMGAHYLPKPVPPAKLRALLRWITRER